MDESDTDIRSQLYEREKELDALYKLAGLFTEPGMQPEDILGRTSEILKESMQFPENAEVRITLQAAGDDRIEARVFGDGNDTEVCSASAVFNDDKLIRIIITYFPDAGTGGSGLEFLERERYLVQSTASLLANVLQKNELEISLRQSTDKLQRQTQDLENKNIALQEVLSQYNIEKNKYISEMSTFFDSIIYPELNKLIINPQLSEHPRDIILNVRTSLENKFKNNFDSLLKIQHLLTPRELEICSLIKNGMSTKDISTHLSISELTVERHRNTIRKKLGLNNSGSNLTTYLRTRI